MISLARRRDIEQLNILREERATLVAENARLKSEVESVRRDARAHIVNEAGKFNAEMAKQLASDRALLETARDLLSRCPGIRTDETQPYWDEVQSFLGRDKV